jgi:transposase-like protein
MKKHRNHEAGFKARAILEAIKGARTVSELVAGNGILHPCLC